MAQVDDRFELRPGRPRSDGGHAAKGWRRDLERHIGRHISGIDRGDTIDWTIGRGHGGPAL